MARKDVEDGMTLAETSPHVCFTSCRVVTGF
jgi:hypothetical protein